jgi:carnosine synthase
MNQVPTQVLNGKTIAVVGLGGKRKIHCYHAMRAWGIRTIIICSELDPSPDASYADNVLVVHGLYEHSNDENNSKKIIAALNKSHLGPDGVLTLWEDCGPLAAHVALGLGLPGVNPQTASIAKSKYETHDALARPSTNSSGQRLHVNTRRCNSISELNEAIGQIGLPAILKLEHGSSAAAVVPVYTPAEAEDAWNRIKQTLKSETDWPGIGLGFGPNIVLSQLLEGTEHDVDIVLWKGNRIGSFVTDNGPTRQLSCAESSALMPSTAAKETRSLIIEAASEACRRLGMTTGVFNIELINTLHGPRIIDINARMGGFYIRDWVLEIWGYDLLRAAVLCCAEIMPERAPARYEKYIAGIMLSPSVHGRWLSDPDNIRRLRSAAFSKGTILIEFEEGVRSHELVDEPWGNLAVVKQTASEAVLSLLELCDALGLTGSDPELARLLPRFEDHAADS